METWKKLNGYGRDYEVSDYGNVRYIDFDGSIVSVKQTKLYNGYKKVNLRVKKGVFKTGLVHRLVGECFLDKRDGEDSINHKDFDKENNHISNLEWCDCAYNVNYSKSNRKFIETRNVHKIKDGKIIQTYHSGYLAAKENGIKVSGVYSCCRGQRKNYKGYEWKYE